MAEQNEPGFSHLQIVVPFKLKVRHHGVDYVWKKGGEAITMPIEAAEHCFGFGLDDKSRAFHRLGWLTSSDSAESAQEKLESIEFRPVRQVFEIQAGRNRKKSSNARSLVTAGGAAGPDSESPNPVPDDQDDDEDDEVSAEAL